MQGQIMIISSGGFYKTNGPIGGSGNQNINLQYP
jgi:hypothetical protein